MHTTQLGFHEMPCGKKGVISIQESQQMANTSGYFCYIRNDKAAIIAFTDVEVFTQIRLANKCGYSTSLVPRYIDTKPYNKVPDIINKLYPNYTIVNSVEQFNKLLDLGNNKPTTAEEIAIVSDSEV